MRVPQWRPLLALAALCAAPCVRPGLAAGDMGDTGGAAAAAAADEAWQRVVGWMRAHGAVVSRKLQGDALSHGGVAVRGVVATADLAASEPLLRVPSRLWLSLEQFPEIQGANLSRAGACVAGPRNGSELSWSQAATLKLAAAAALEAARGPDSFFSPYLQTLPTRRDFEAVDPHFAAPSLLASFGALPPVRQVRAELQLEAALRGCFEAWQRGEAGEPAEGLQSLSWENMRLALAWLRTRGVRTPSGAPALVPGADLLNTEADGGPVGVNAEASMGADAFRVDVWRDAGVEAGQELLEAYCGDCDNAEFFAAWGVYLEDNQIPVPKDLDCAAPAQQPLRRAAEAALGTADLGPPEDPWTAPRCRPEVLASAQGPLECSFARLAWEYCSWAWHGSAAAPGSDRALGGGGGVSGAASLEQRGRSSKPRLRTSAVLNAG